MDFDFADVLLETIDLGASDLHLTAGSPPMVRIRGRMRPLDYAPMTPQVTREVVYSFLNNDQRKRLEEDWQIDLSYSVPGKARFRVNAFFQRASIGAVMRTIPQDIPKFDSLGLPPTILEFTLSAVIIAYQFNWTYLLVVAATVIWPTATFSVPVGC